MKLGLLTANGDPTPFDYGDVFFRQPCGDGERLVIGPTSGQVGLLCDLASLFPEGGYWVLYVLLVSQAGNREGRYQSPRIESYEDLELFLWTFQTFLEGDGRHHIWVGSIASSDLLVYDQHDVVFVYGDLDAVEARLQEGGYVEREFSLPAPHTHSFPAENAHWEQELLGAFDWRWSELQEGDA